MNKNDKPVIVNGIVSRVNLVDAYNLTSQKDVDMLNEKRKANHQKSISLKVGFKQKGIGDIIDVITKKSGIKWLILKIFKECGCEKRRKYLNKWSIYIPFIRADNRTKFIPIQAAKEEVIRLEEPNVIYDTAPIPRSMVSKNRKSCGCGKERL
jgi:hypothetical protein